MSGVTLTYDLEGHVEAAELLDRLKAKLTDLTPVMAAIGEDILFGIEDAFAGEQSPSGQAWRSSRRAEKEGGKTLQDTRRLLNSLHVVAGPDSVSVGTNVIYGATQHFGAKAGSFGEVIARVAAFTRKGGVKVREHTRRMRVPWGDIPARPFLGVSDETQEGIIETLREYLVDSSQ